MTKREAMKLKEGEVFRKKPDAVFNREGLIPELYKVSHTVVVADEVIVYDTKGMEFTHKDICRP